MLNVCVECLREGVVADEETVDGAMIFATGFAPFRGGPLHYARARGVARDRGRRCGSSPNAMVSASGPIRAGTVWHDPRRSRAGAIPGRRIGSPTRSSPASARTSCWRCRSASARPITSPTRLFARAAADPSIKLHIFTALTLEKPRPRQELERRFLAPLAERVFGGYPDLAYAVALHRSRLPPNVQVDEFFFQAGTRLGVPASQQSYISANYTHALRYVLERGVNVLGQLVARRVRGGETRLSLSCNPDMTLDLLSLRRAGRLRLSVRRAGQFGAAVHARRRRHCRERSRFHAGSPRDFPPVRAAARAGRHRRICRRPARGGIVVDGGTLQLGIGSLGDAMAQALILRHRRNADFRDILARLDPAGIDAGGIARERAVRGRPAWRERDVRRGLSRPHARGHPQARGRRHAACRRRSSSARARSIARCGRCRRASSPSCG